MKMTQKKTPKRIDRIHWNGFSFDPLFIYFDITIVFTYIDFIMRLKVELLTDL